jgi:UDPglucose 6-dehydrogenase/GDP-mannose 6-dehydrogenase
VDIDPAKVAAVNAGHCPIHEKDLPAMIARHAGTSLTATTDLAAAMRETAVTLLALPTPFDGQSIDLSSIRQVARQIGAALTDKAAYHVVVIKSTVVPGTTDDVVGPLIAQASGKSPGPGFGLGMNPEFLSEGAAVADCMNPDRIVAGGIDDRTRDAIAALYQGFPEVPILRTNNRTAETVKYAANALQATMISFANEIANLCERIGGVDAVDVMHGVHAMKELSPVNENETAPRPTPITGFLMPGCGFGGSCFPKDLKAITAYGKALGVSMPLLDSVIAVNAARPIRMVDLVDEELGGLVGKFIAVLGLAFKPNTDDMRESPAVPIVHELRRRGARVVAYDPVAMAEARKLFGADAPAFAASMEEAVRDAAAILLVTRWPEFAKLPKLLAARSDTPLLVDGRRLIAPSAVSRYRGIGLAGIKRQ